MSDTIVNLTAEQRLQEQVASLRMQVSNLHLEVEAFRADEGSWLAGARLQQKIARQAKALYNLNKRVRVQRLMLRELNEQNPELANTLFFIVKDKYAAELDDVTGLQF